MTRRAGRGSSSTTLITPVRRQVVAPAVTVSCQRWVPGEAKVWVTLSPVSAALPSPASQRAVGAAHPAVSTVARKGTGVARAAISGTVALQARAHPSGATGMACARHPARLW